MLTREFRQVVQPRVSGEVVILRNNYSVMWLIM